MILSSVVGTPFYLMDHIQGRVFKDPSLPGMTRSERQDIYQAMCDVLCKVHSVDINKADLQQYGKHGKCREPNLVDTFRWLAVYWLQIDKPATQATSSQTKVVVKPFGMLWPTAGSYGQFQL